MYLNGPAAHGRFDGVMAMAAAVRGCGWQNLEQGRENRVSRSGVETRPLNVPYANIYEGC